MKPPSSGPIELMLVGCAFLVAPSDVDDVVRQVDASCFTHPTIGRCWESIVRQWAKPDYADPFLTATDAAGDGDPIQLVDTLVKASENAISGAFLRPRAEELLRMKRRRELMQFGHETIQDAASTSDLDGLVAYIGRFAEMMDDIRSREETGDIGPIANRVEQRAASGQAKGWPTGINDYDQWQGGLHRSRIHVIGGAPGSGKTWVAAQLVNAMVDHGELVLFFSIEMSAGEMYVRVMANRIGFKAYRLTGENRTWGADEHAEYKAERAKLEEHCKLLTCRSFADISAHVRALQPAAFVIDFVQLMANPPDTRPGYEAQTENANMLMNLCHKSDAAMVLVTQMGRESLRAGVNSPVIGSRDSGRWDEIAELFVQVSQGEAYRDSLGVMRSGIRLDCRKNRHGPTGGKGLYRLDHDSGRLVPC